MARRTGIEPITIWIQRLAQPRRKNALARLSLLDSISRSVRSIVIEPSLPARILLEYRPTVIECRCPLDGNSSWLSKPHGAYAENLRTCLSVNVQTPSMGQIR